MRFLADESCDFSVVRALRSADHDVLAIAEVSPREEDDAVMERAVRGGRILLTVHQRVTPLEGQVLQSNIPLLLGG